MTKAILLLEDGSVFEGTRFGAQRDAICEMVFNTGLTGYLELLTDASYAGQGIVMASPIMGNYGIFEEQGESWRPWVEAMVIRDLTCLQNDIRQAGNLDDYLEKNAGSVLELQNETDLAQNFTSETVRMAELEINQQHDLIAKT